MAQFRSSALAMGSISFVGGQGFKGPNHLQAGTDEFMSEVLSRGT
jgi:hypothetical protein